MGGTGGGFPVPGVKFVKVVGTAVTFPKVMLAKVIFTKMAPAIAAFTKVLVATGDGYKSQVSPRCGPSAKGEPYSRQATGSLNCG